MHHLDKRRPQGLLLQDLGAHNPEPTDFGELRVCQGPCQGGAVRPAQAVGDQGLQLPPGSPSRAGAHGPFSPFNSQHRSPWGATPGDGGSLPWRDPTLGWQQLVVRNPFCPIHPEAAFPHHFFPLDVCSEACSRHAGHQQPVPFGGACLEPRHIYRYAFVFLQLADGTEATPGSALAHRGRCKTLLLNARHDNLFFFPCILAVINWSDAISGFLCASPGASS